MTGNEEHAAGLGEVYDELVALEEVVDTPAERERVREAIQAVGDVQPGSFGTVVVGFDRTDAAEAFFGSVLFGLPMLVEGGTQEVGSFVAAHPLRLLATVLTALVLVTGILYVAEFRDVRIYRPLFGLVPRRWIGVVGISFLTSMAAMTLWGRADWTDPWVALSQCTVAFVPMVIGAALGDILPGS